MLNEDLVREIVALRRRVERLEAQEPVAGAVRNASGEGLTVDADGTVTVRLGDAAGVERLQVLDSGGAEVARIDSDGGVQVDGGINVGTATGAGEGDVLTSGVLRLGNTNGVIGQGRFTLAPGESLAVLPGFGSLGGLFSINNTSIGHYLLAARSGGGIYILLDPSSAWANTDTAGKHCLFVTGGQTTLKNNHVDSQSYRVVFLT